MHTYSILQHMLYTVISFFYSCMFLMPLFSVCHTLVIYTLSIFFFLAVADGRIVLLDPPETTQSVTIVSDAF